MFTWEKVVETTVKDVGIDGSVTIGDTQTTITINGQTTVIEHAHTTKPKKREPVLPNVVLNHSIILLATGISMSRYGERYLNCIEINNAGGYDGVRAYPVAYCNKGQTFPLKSGESFEDAFTRFTQEYPTYIFLDAREHYNQMPEPETIDETKRVEVYVDGELVFDSLD